MDGNLESKDAGPAKITTRSEAADEYFDFAAGRVEQKQPARVQVNKAMKNPYRKINRRHYSLGELVEIVASCAKSNVEAIAAMKDLFESGRVLVHANGRAKKVRCD